MRTHAAPSCPVEIVENVASEATRAEGEYLAAAARRKRARVVAFDRMVDELREHDAPADFVVRAKAARSDAVRHARTLANLARKAGAVVSSVSVAPRCDRCLMEMALENVEEGCIRETYTALIAHLQAIHAEDPEVRTVMTVVARDEAEHAALSWDLYAWARGLLSPLELLLLEEAQHLARLQLLKECGVEERPEVRRAVGLPDAGESMLLLQSLFEELPLAA